MTINPLQQQMSTLILESKLSDTVASLDKDSAPFSDLFAQALQSVNELQQDSSQLSHQFDQGDRSISLSDVMIARNKSSVAFEATLQVRNKMVDAYKELMNMPV